MATVAKDGRAAPSVRPGVPTRDRGMRLASAGGALAALGAASCCVVPFVLFALGISGAWIGNLTALAPYQPIFAALSLTLLGIGFVRVHGRSKATACAEGSYCARPASDRIAKAGLWAATVLIAVALAWPYAAPFFLDR